MRKFHFAQDLWLSDFVGQTAPALDLQPCIMFPGSVQKVGISRRLHQWPRGGRDRLKQVAASRAERTVVDRTPNLQQQVGASSRPSHLLRLVHPPVDQEVSGTF